MQQNQQHQHKHQQPQKQQPCLATDPAFGAWLVASGVLGVCGSETALSLLRLLHPEEADLLSKCCAPYERS
jgi:hypothetical protein